MKETRFGHQENKLKYSWRFTGLDPGHADHMS